jgi:hypothetical protein
MLLFTATSIEHVIPFDDDTCEEIKFKGKMEILFGLTSNEEINKRWLEVGASVCDFTLYIRCAEEDSDVPTEFNSVKIAANLRFGKDIDVGGGGTAYLNFKHFKKLLQSISNSPKSIYFPLGELGSSYVKSEIDKFECKIKLEFSQVSVSLN